MVYTGTPAARGSGVGNSHVTWAAVLSDWGIQRERGTPITSYSTFNETVIILCDTYCEKKRAVEIQHYLPQPGVQHRNRPGLLPVEFEMREYVRATRLMPTLPPPGISGLVGPG